MPTSLKRERVDGAGLLAFWGAGLLCLFFCAGAWGGQNVSLAWDAVSDPSVAGYAVYYGTVSGGYSTRLDAGTNTKITVPGLTEGLTYYFVYVVYDALGEESAPSNEVAYLVPGVIFLSPGGPGGPTRVIFPIAPPHWYELQATTDLQTWTTIWQTEPASANVWLEYLDFEAPQYATRFYRLEMH